MSVNIKQIFKDVKNEYLAQAKQDIKTLFQKQKENISAAIMQTKPAQELKRQETIKTINQNLIWIVLGIAVLIYIGYNLRR